MEAVDPRVRQPRPWEAVRPSGEHILSPGNAAVEARRGRREGGEAEGGHDRLQLLVAEQGLEVSRVPQGQLPHARGYRGSLVFHWELLLKDVLDLDPDFDLGLDLDVAPTKKKEKKRNAEDLVSLR